MHAKKQNQPDAVSETSLDENLDFSDSDVIILNTDYNGIDLTCAGADTTYSISGIDTITLDNNVMWNGSTGDTLTWNSDYAINNGPVNIGKNGIEMEAGSDIKIGGISLNETLEHIQERLAILKPNEDLESRWESLKELRRQYVELEKDILEKEKIMNILKS